MWNVTRLSSEYQQTVLRAAALVCVRVARVCACRAPRHQRAAAAWHRVCGLQPPLQQTAGTGRTCVHPDQQQRLQEWEGQGHLTLLLRQPSAAQVTGRQAVSAECCWVVMLLQPPNAKSSWVALSVAAEDLSTCDAVGPVQGCKLPDYICKQTFRGLQHNLTAGAMQPASLLSVCCDVPC